MEDNLLTSVEAAKKLGISRQYLYELVKKGTVAAIREEPTGPFKTRPSWKFKASDIDALLKKDRNPKVA